MRCFCAILFAVVSAAASCKGDDDGHSSLDLMHESATVTGCAVAQAVQAIDKTLCGVSASNLLWCIEDGIAKSRLFYSFRGTDDDGRFADLSPDMQVQTLKMARCAASVYKGVDLPEGFVSRPPAWCGQIIASDDLRHCTCLGDGRIVSTSGLAVRMMTDVTTNTLIIIFAGVESVDDGRVDSALQAVFSGNTRGQLLEAAALLKAVSGRWCGKITVIGHSFGGLLAVYSVVVQESADQMDCYMFNPLGVPYELFRQMDIARLTAAANKMMAVRHPMDLLRFLPGRHPGKMYRIEDDGNLSSTEAHSIKRMIALMERTCLKEAPTVRSK